MIRATLSLVAFSCLSAIARIASADVAPPEPQPSNNGPAMDPLHVVVLIGVAVVAMAVVLVVSRRRTAMAR